jgi:methyltransferase, FkbM family
MKALDPLRRLRHALSGQNRRRSFEDFCREELIFYARYLRAGMTVLDVGAHRGELSLFFARCVGPTGRVFAFEPAREAYAAIEHVVNANGRRNIHPRPLAVGDAEGTAILHGRSDRPTLHSFLSRAVHAQGPSVSEEVRVTTLDAFCRGENIETVDLLKIDVEGCELAALKGAEALFAAGRIRCCAFEFGETTRDAGLCVRDFQHFFNRFNYRLRNMPPQTSMPPAGVYSITMLIATPRT